jgi:large subunit ribosomal protein L13
MKTISVRSEDVQRAWWLVDADGRTLGRLASVIASRLRGKHKPEYTPHSDTGDYIVVVNAEKVAVTGRKASDKIYYWHSGYPGGIKQASFEQMIAKHPTRVIEHAVKGMLPHNPLGRAMLRKLKIYAGPAHPHSGQQPVPLAL